MSNLQSILAKSGISQGNRENGEKGTPGQKLVKTLESRLENSGLGLDLILAELASVIQNSESEGNKLKAIQDVLKMHGVMKDSGAAPTSVNIIIQDSRFDNGMNPILFPREVSLDLAYTDVE